MKLQMATLLMHSADVPTSARDALRAAFAGTHEDRDELLESAARILHRETELGCADVRELVGLGAGAGCD
ncbi:MAG: hypothetical protein M3680_34925 [Myxococcota bacterium]|nr:hypothetical protein [Myxococcota bacterium]